MAENRLTLDLQAFADEVGNTAEGTGVTTAAAAQGKGDKNPLANVKYGKQEEAQAADVQNDTDERATRFSAFRQEYKPEIDAEIQGVVQRRLKSTKETVDRYNKLTPVLQILGQKYGVDANDAEALAKAIEDDDSYFEDEAFEKGMSVADLKAVKRMERENAELRQQIEASQQQAKMEADVARWMAEAEEAKKVFPGLDLGVELQNPNFVELLRNNVDLQTAYFAVHQRELVPQAMQYAAIKTQQNMSQALQAGRRPSENPTAGSSTAVTKSDVASLTKEDRAEIMRRVARGERITF